MNDRQGQRGISCAHAQFLQIAVINVMAAPVGHCIELNAVGEFHGCFFLPWAERALVSQPDCFNAWGDLRVSWSSNRELNAGNRYLYKVMSPDGAYPNQ